MPHVHWIIKRIDEERVRKRMTLMSLSREAGYLGNVTGKYMNGDNSLIALRFIERTLGVLGLKLAVVAKDVSE